MLKLQSMRASFALGALIAAIGCGSSAKPAGGPRAAGDCEVDKDCGVGGFCLKSKCESPGVSNGPIPEDACSNIRALTEKQKAHEGAPLDEPTKKQELAQCIAELKDMQSVDPKIYRCYAPCSASAATYIELKRCKERCLETKQ